MYRVVLIFPDAASLAAFVEYMKIPGEVENREFAFVGNLTEDQIREARVRFGAYVRVVRHWVDEK